MRHDGENDATRPQIKQDIIECRWVHLGHLPAKIANYVPARIDYLTDFWRQNIAYLIRSQDRFRSHVLASVMALCCARAALK